MRWLVPLLGVSLSVGCSFAGGANTENPQVDAAPDDESDSGNIVPSCELTPSNGAVAGHLFGVTAGLSTEVAATTTINSDDGSIVSTGGTTRGAAIGAVVDGIGFFALSDSLAVLAVANVSVADQSRVRITGARAVIVLSGGDITINGEIDVSGGCDNGDAHCAGAGGFRGARDGAPAQGCSPGANGVSGADPETGGGGGGFGADGAPGGDGNGSTPGATGGDATSCDKDLIPLVGGSGGGKAGGDPFPNGGPGGGGGGAVQFSSMTRISCVGVAGNRAVVWAGGAGGARSVNLASNGGGGGGAGGGIFFEAPKVSLVDCSLAANGGGGGDGDGRNAPSPAEPGTQTVDQALGGGVPEATTSAGGNGGALSGAATQGAGPIDGSGGGGGAVGVVRLSAPTEGMNRANDVVSPAPMLTQADCE